MEALRDWTEDNSSVRIKLILTGLRKTQAELAYTLGVSLATVNRWCKGKHIPDFRSRRALAALEDQL